jgi:hypothetical protein
MIARRLGNMSEPADPNTLLLLHGEDFTDSSRDPSVITNNGAVITASGKFGSGISIPSTSIQYLSVADHSKFILGTGNFTIECWAKLLTGSNSATTFACKRYMPTGYYYGWDFLVLGTTRYLRFQFGNGATSGNTVLTASSASPVNSWAHYAVVRNGTSLKLYVNGVSVASTTISAGASIVNRNTPLLIGATVTGAEMNLGNSEPMILDEFRFSNIARWTGNFTPPTAPYKSR